MRRYQQVMIYQSGEVRGRALTAVEPRGDTFQGGPDVLGLGTVALVRFIIGMLGREGQGLSCEGKCA